MAEDCIFCKIAAGEIPSKKVAERETVYAFHDIRPRAPTHVLIIPKRHIGTINDITPETAGVMADLVLMAKEIAGLLKVDQSGYRLVFNCGPDAGMEVNHIHLHLLGGRQMTWPPG
jgi:histidine triad (HIT) family protein